MKIKYMYFIKYIDIYGITPVRTGRTRPLTCIFIKNNAFGTLTGTTKDVQVAPSKINEFQYTFRYPRKGNGNQQYNKSTQSLECLISIPTGTKYQYGTISNN